MRINQLKHLLFVSIFIVYLSGCSKSGEILSQSEPTYILEQETMNTIAWVKLFEEQTRELLESDSIEAINQGTMAILRMDRYGYGSLGIEKIVWDAYAGPMAVEWVRYIKNNPSWVIDFREKSWFFSDPVSNDAIDFIHLVAVVNVFYTKTDMDTTQEKYYDALLSWGGDLLTMAYVGESSEFLGDKESLFFSTEDYLADIDGVNIAQLMIEDELLLSDALYAYYTSEKVKWRHSLFTDYYGGEDEAYKFIYDFIFLEGDGSEDFNKFKLVFKSIQDGLIQYVVNDSEYVSEEELKRFVDAFVEKLKHN
jgi:hypothetical protein